MALAATRLSEEEVELLNRVLQWSYMHGLQGHSVLMAPDLGISLADAGKCLSQLKSFGLMRSVSNSVTLMTARGIMETEQRGLIEPEYIALRKRAYEGLEAERRQDMEALRQLQTEINQNDEMKIMFNALKTALG